MGLEADAGTILKIAGDAGGCDDGSDASVNGSMRIEGDAGGGDGDYGESGTSGPDGMDLDLGGRDACGSDGDGGEDGSMGMEANAGAVSEVEGGVDGAGDAAAPVAAFVPIPRKHRSPTGKQRQNQLYARRRRAALERRALAAENTAIDNVTEPSGSSP